MAYFLAMEMRPGGFYFKSLLKTVAKIADNITRPLSLKGFTMPLCLRDVLALCLCFMFHLLIGFLGLWCCGPSLLIPRQFLPQYLWGISSLFTDQFATNTTPWLSSTTLHQRSNKQFPSTPKSTANWGEMLNENKDSRTLMSPPTAASFEV